MMIYDKSFFDFPTEYPECKLLLFPCHALPFKNLTNRISSDLSALVPGMLYTYREKNMGSFSVGFRSFGAVEVLALVGELDAHTVSELEAAIQKCLQDGRYQIVVDGTRLLYISSAGLGAFVGHIEEIRSQGGDIKIAALIPKILNVFDLLGLPLLFDIVNTREEAFALFEPQLEPDPTLSV